MNKKGSLVYRLGWREKQIRGSSPIATPFFVWRILSWVVGGAPKCQSYGVYLEEVQIRYLEKDLFLAETLLDGK